MGFVQYKITPKDWSTVTCFEYYVSILQVNLLRDFFINTNLVKLIQLRITNNTYMLVNLFITLKKRHNYDIGKDLTSV